MLLKKPLHFPNQIIANTHCFKSFFSLAFEPCKGRVRLCQPFRPLPCFVSTSKIVLKMSKEWTSWYKMFLLKKQITVKTNTLLTQSVTIHTMTIVEKFCYSCWSAFGPGFWSIDASQNGGHQALIFHGTKVLLTKFGVIMGKSKQVAYRNETNK